MQIRLQSDGKRGIMLHSICPWHSWIARETPTLEAAGSNPVGQAKKVYRTLVVRYTFLVLLYHAEPLKSLAI